MTEFEGLLGKFTLEVASLNPDENKLRAAHLLGEIVEKIAISPQKTAIIEFTEVSDPSKEELNGLASGLQELFAESGIKVGVEAKPWTELGDIDRILVSLRE